MDAKPPTPVESALVDLRGLISKWIDNGLNEFEITSVLEAQKHDILTRRWCLIEAAARKNRAGN